MKKIKILLLVSLLFSCLGITSCSSKPTEGLEYIPINDAECSVAIGSANSSKIIIPEQYQNYQVVAIADDGFSDCDFVEEIELPNTIKSIGSSAFAQCDLLSKIELPDGIEKIEKNAFFNCNSLTRIDIPSSVSYVGDTVFSLSGNLKEVHFEENFKIQTMGKNIFQNCQSLAKITIPFVGEKRDGSGSTNFGFIIGSDTYETNSYIGKSLKEVVITGGTQIEENAFRNFVYIEKIVLPETIESIGHRAFYACSKLASINIPNSVKKIGVRIFERCDSLKKITLSFLGMTKGEEGLFSDISYGAPITEVIYTGDTNLGFRAFISAYITSIEIVGNVEIIKNEAFYGCTNLETIKFPETLITIGDNVFYDCRSLKSVEFPNGTKTIGAYSFKNCSSLTTLVLPKELDGIYLRAFEGCSSLSKVVIPVGTRYIGPSAFKTGNGEMEIFCEAESQPTEWDKSWTHEEVKVYWKGQWKYNSKGEPVAK